MLIHRSTGGEREMETTTTKKKKSLAIVERQGPQNRRPVAGCVGVLFLHLFDWNRSLATKKHRKKTKKRTLSLLPPLLRRCPKPSSSHSSLSSPPPPPPPPPPRQLTSSGESQINSTTPMQAPGLLARLMGLESMPVSKFRKTQNDPNKPFLPAKGTQPSKDLSSDARPMKMQKTTNRLSDPISNSCSTHLKMYHHNSTCLSSRSPRARLIQAATKILEPGLRPRLPVSPSNSSVRNIEENVIFGSLLGSNANIGTFSENKMEPVVISGEQPNVNLPAAKNILEETRNTREDALSYMVHGRNCTHLEQNVNGLAISGRRMEVNNQIQRNHGEQHKVPKNTTLIPVSTGKIVPKANITGANLKKRVTDKPFGSGYLRPKKNVNPPLKDCTISNSINTANRKRRTASDLTKKTELLPLGNRSSSRVCPKREMVKKRENNRASSLSSSRVKQVLKKSTVNGVENQTNYLRKERLKVKDCASNLIVSILEDLVSEVSEETGLFLSGNNTPCCNVSQGKKNTGLSNYLVTLDDDQPSPISILEASFSSDTSLGSPVNEADTMQKLPDFDNFNISTRKTSNSDLQILANRVGCTSEVFSNIELMFGKNWIEQEDFSVHSFLLDLLKNIMDVFDGSLNGEKESYQLTNFLFDSIMEFLDWKSSYFCNSGYNGWLVVSQSLNRDQLFNEILKEMHRWSEMGGKAPYALAHGDLRNSNDRWSKCSFEGFEIGVEIEGAIVQMLVDEFLSDLC